MLRDADMLALLMARKPKHSLPQPFYTDPDLYQIDLQRLFYVDWLFAIPACEIPKTGNFVTMAVGAY